MIVSTFAPPVQIPKFHPKRTAEVKLSLRSRHQLYKFVASARPTTAGEVVKRFWNLQRDGNFRATNYLFAPHAVYHDTLYNTPFEGYDAVDKHLDTMDDVLPSGILFVLDDIAAAEEKVGARWHAETASGSNVPFSRGASMYTVEKDGQGGMWITEAWDFVETPFKVAGIVLPVFRFASAALRMFGGKRKKAAEGPSKREGASEQ